MAFPVKHKGNCCVDFYDLKGQRHRSIVARGLSKESWQAAKTQAKLLTLQLKAERTQRRKTISADPEFVIQSWLDGSKRLEIPGKITDVSARSQDRYRVYARKIIQFCKDQNVKSFSALTDYHVQLYRDDRSKTAAAKTVHNEMTAWRTLCKWATKHGFIGKDVALEVQKPNVPIRYPMPYTHDQISQLMQAAWVQPRIYLMLCLGYYQGLRMSSVCTLKSGDVQLERSPPVIKVWTKGDDEQWLALHQDTIEAMKRCPAVPNNQYWLGDESVSKMGDVSHQISRFIRDVLGLTRSQMKMPFHNLRRTFAVHAHNAGQSSRKLQSALGHSSLRITEGYLASCKQDVSYDVVNALSSWKSNGSKTSAGSDTKPDPVDGPLIAQEIPKPISP